MKKTSGFDADRIPLWGCLLAIFAGTWFVSIGIHNAPAWWGDEYAHFSAARLVARGEVRSTNLFYLTTAAFMQAGMQPIQIHFFFRVANTLLYACALFFCLDAFRPFLLRTGCLLATLVWIPSFSSMPYSQQGNFHTFAACTALFGLVVLLRNPTLCGFLVFSLAMIWASQMRKELLLPFLFVGGLVIGKACTVRKEWRSSFQAAGRSPGFWIAAILVSGSLVFLKVHPSSAPEGFVDQSDQHLLMGLGQNYAVYHHKNHPEEALDPGTEYLKILNSVFKHPRSFQEAVLNNPAEATAYFFHNFTNNMLQVGPRMLSCRDSGGRNGLGFFARFHAVVLAGVLLIGIGGIVLVLLKRGDALFPLPVGMTWKLGALFCFGTGSSVALVMHYPMERYWLTLGPLVFGFVAFAFSGVLRVSRLENRPFLQVAAVFVVLLVFDRPVFAGLPDGNATIRKLQEAMAGLPRPIRLAANNPAPFSVYLLEGNAKLSSPMEGFTLADFRAGAYDVVLINSGLRNTSLWAGARKEFEDVVAHPQVYGYCRDEAASEGDLTVLIKKASLRVP